MKSYLVDVSVSINIWIRLECQRQQFEDRLDEFFKEIMQFVFEIYNYFNLKRNYKMSHINNSLFIE